MGHNSSCAYAKGDSCSCSCGKLLHGGGGHGIKIRKGNHRKWSTTSSALKSGREVAINVSASTMSIVMPQVGTIYAAYKTGSFVYKIYKNLEKDDNKGAVIELLKDLFSRTIKNISENHAVIISGNIRKAAETSGLIKEFSNKIGIDEQTIGTMFEGTVKASIINNSENIAKYTVDKLGEYI